MKNKRKIKVAIVVFPLVNRLIPKRKNRIYARCRILYPEAKCDLINNSSSNMLRLLNEYGKIKHSKKIDIFLEYTDATRFDLLDEFAEAAKKNNVFFHFLKGKNYEDRRLQKLLHWIKNIFIRFSSVIWLCETGDTYNAVQTKKQKIICLNYFISCKNDLIVGHNFRWSYLDGIVSTSLLVSQIMSASMGVKLDKCYNLGFPRNDVFFKQEKKDLVLKWITQKVGFIPKHIILYAPTYRDYELDDTYFAGLFLKDGDSIENYKKSNRPMLGYEAPTLNDLLLSKEAVFIHHLHPLQKVDIINENNSMIAYEDNYNFTFYDLMAVSDCLITDYSSIGYDYLLTDKPLIYNLYDLSTYESSRGLSYDPYEDFCAGAIVTNWEEMQQALENVFCGNDVYKEKRQSVKRLLHKHTDGNSTQRVVQFLEQVIDGTIK